MENGKIEFCKVDKKNHLAMFTSLQNSGTSNARNYLLDLTDLKSYLMCDKTKMLHMLKVGVKDKPLMLFLFENLALSSLENNVSQVILHS